MKPIVAVLGILILGGLASVYYYRSQNSMQTPSFLTAIDPPLSKLSFQTIGYDVYHAWGVPDGTFYVRYENTQGDMWLVWLLDSQSHYLLEMGQYGVAVGDEVEVHGEWAGNVGTVTFTPSNCFKVDSVIKLPQL